MYEKALSQAETMLRPFGEIVDLHFQALDTLRRKQAEIMSEIVADGIEHAQHLVKPSLNIDEKVTAQQAYLNGLKEKMQSTANSNYEFFHQWQDKTGDLWREMFSFAPSAYSANPFLKAAKLPASIPNSTVIQNPEVIHEATKNIAEASIHTAEKIIEKAEPKVSSPVKKADSSQPEFDFKETEALKKTSPETVLKQAAKEKGVDVHKQANASSTAPSNPVNASSKLSSAIHNQLAKQDITTLKEIEVLADTTMVNKKGGAEHAETQQANKPSSSSSKTGNKKGSGGRTTQTRAVSASETTSPSSKKKTTTAKKTTKKSSPSTRAKKATPVSSPSA